MNEATIRPGTPDDLIEVMRILDGALLDADAKGVRARLDAGEALVAAVDGRVVGVLVLDGTHVEAVAVRRSRRRHGIGRALVRAARERVGGLTADFDPRVRGFYESLGFEIEERGGRLWGVTESARRD